MISISVNATQLTGSNTHLIKRGDGDDDAASRRQNRTQQLPQPIDNEVAASTACYAVYKQSAASSRKHTYHVEC